MKLKIEERRKSLGYSKAQLADKVGIHRSNIGRIESGSLTPSLILLDKIAIALKTTIDDLIERED